MNSIGSKRRTLFIPRSEITTKIWNAFEQVINQPIISKSWSTLIVTFGDKDHRDHGVKLKGELKVVQTMQTYS